ncbi:hypothetical protein EVC23_004 [Rhizobium phage RHph_N3_8]|uniref:hypothetical protein n=1 Tax=Rhizobium phage RHph_N3_8 TaxID=2509748 RepID=UPI001AF2C179|nr:hypothetical protein QEJ65_gp04 [Rhizobium phage RHph_N3_8]QIG76003.1 hypothetical protein EVC23_004 [Rhizobium phage RHph_N3_8]
MKYDKPIHKSRIRRKVALLHRNLPNLQSTNLLHGKRIHRTLRESNRQITTPHRHGRTPHLQQLRRQTSWQNTKQVRDCSARYAGINGWTTSNTVITTTNTNPPASAVGTARKGTDNEIPHRRIRTGNSQ